MVPTSHPCLLFGEKSHVLCLFSNWLVWVFSLLNFFSTGAREALDILGRERCAFLPSGPAFGCCQYLQSVPKLVSSSRWPEEPRIHRFLQEDEDSHSSRTESVCGRGDLAHRERDSRLEGLQMAGSETALCGRGSSELSTGCEALKMAEPSKHPSPCRELGLRPSCASAEPDRSRAITPSSGGRVVCCCETKAGWLERGHPSSHSVRPSVSQGLGSWAVWLRVSPEVVVGTSAEAPVTCRLDGGWRVPKLARSHRVGGRPQVLAPWTLPGLVPPGRAVRGGHRAAA
ncbi:uncharacterized protein LOC121020028 isoform X2 [Herpailurus yagouaroundi]|uniref:uncharacterized protein LOC121020028 isoform X2 n=1 Tax=Herpailurus yagouaroundi TaxID=1608482 RepID=UPI001AD7A28C|nr:uncharacterized protein LOC121020028 isoform X2 [Puma yagouaroundi]